MQQVDNVVISNYLSVGLKFDVNVGLKLPNSLCNIFINDFISGAFIWKLLKKLLFHLAFVVPFSLTLLIDCVGNFLLIHFLSVEKF